METRGFCWRFIVWGGEKKIRRRELLPSGSAAPAEDVQFLRGRGRGHDRDNRTQHEDFHPRFFITQFGVFFVFFLMDVKAESILSFPCQSGTLLCIPEKMVSLGRGERQVVRRRKSNREAKVRNDSFSGLPEEASSHQSSAKDGVKEDQRETKGEDDGEEWSPELQLTDCGS